MKIISPSQEHEWKAYFQLRFDVLREPWNQPPGSEVLGDEDQAIRSGMLAATHIAEHDGVVGFDARWRASPGIGTGTAESSACV